MEGPPKADNQKVQSPRIELGTSSVLTMRHNQLDHDCAW